MRQTLADWLTEILNYLHLLQPRRSDATQAQKASNTNALNIVVFLLCAIFCLSFSSHVQQTLLLHVFAALFLHCGASTHTITKHLFMQETLS